MRGWTYRLTARREDDATFEQNRDWFANELEQSAWFKDKGEVASALWWLWDEIKHAEDVDHFDFVLDAIYDEADEDRCLIRFMSEDE